MLSPPWPPAREAALAAVAVVDAPSLLGLNGQAGLLQVGESGIPRALPRPGRDPLGLTASLRGQSQRGAGKLATQVSQSGWTFSRDLLKSFSRVLAPVGSSFWLARNSL